MRCLDDISRELVVTEKVGTYAIRSPVASAASPNDNSRI